MKDLRTHHQLVVNASEEEQEQLNDLLRNTDTIDTCMDRYVDLCRYDSSSPMLRASDIVRTVCLRNSEHSRWPKQRFISKYYVTGLSTCPAPLRETCDYLLQIHAIATHGLDSAQHCHTSVENLSSL